jgi:streptogramin lyase
VRPHISEPAALRYDETTGAFISKFTQEPFVEEMEGLVFGPDNNLYVTINNVGGGAVLRYDGRTGVFMDEFVTYRSGGFSIPFGLTFGPDHNLYATSISFDPSGVGGIARVMQFSGTTGAFMGIFGDSDSGVLSDPFDLVFGPDGNLYVSDKSIGVVRFNGNGSAMGIFAGSGSNGLDSATGLAFGRDQNLYVASANTDSLLRYNGTDGSFIDTFVVSGSGGLARPCGLTFGPDGHLYVCSQANHSVLRYNGTNGTFIDAFVTSASGGLSSPAFLAFTPFVPLLSIRRSAADIVLSWPIRAADYVLESTPTLSTLSNWAVVTNAPAIVGTEFVLTNSAATDITFYRLRK